MSDRFDVSRFTIVWLAALVLHIIALLFFMASRPDEALIRGGTVSVGFTSPALDVASGGSDGQDRTEQTESETATVPKESEGSVEVEAATVVEDKPEPIQEPEPEPEPEPEIEEETVETNPSIIREVVKPIAAIQETDPEPTPPKDSLLPSRQITQMQETPEPVNSSDLNPQDDLSQNEQLDSQTAEGIGQQDIQSESAPSVGGGATENENSSSVARNSADENYKGIVMRHLAPRVRRLRASGAGASVVGFTITTNGEVEDVRIVSSSNSSRFDREALRAVSRSAPFPIPPGDVNTNFTVRITGR